MSSTCEATSSKCSSNKTVKPDLPTRPIGLLDLPPELLIEIFANNLSFDSRVRSVPWCREHYGTGTVESRPRKHWDWFDRKSRTRFFLICRHLHGIATEALYRQTVFLFEPAWKAHRFLRWHTNIWSHGCSPIRHIALNYGVIHNEYWLLWNYETRGYTKLWGDVRVEDIATPRGFKKLHELLQHMPNLRSVEVRFEIQSYNRNFEEMRHDRHDLRYLLQASFTLDEWCSERREGIEQPLPIFNIDAKIAEHIAKTWDCRRYFSVNRVGLRRQDIDGSPVHWKAALCFNVKWTLRDYDLPIKMPLVTSKERLLTLIRNEQPRPAPSSLQDSD